MSSNILNKLTQISESNAVNVYVPSLDRVVKFRGLTIKQQKDLFTTGLQGNIAGLALQDIITDIIVNNSTETNVYDIHDRVPIIMALRIQGLGNNAVVQKDEDTETIDISSILNHRFDNLTKTAVMNFNDIILVELIVPSLNRDKYINQSHIEELKKQKEITNTIGDLYLYEITKYITTITIDKEVIDCMKMAPKEVVAIVEALPAELNQQIIEFIQAFNKVQQKYLTIDGKTIVFDARLFSVE